MTQKKTHPTHCKKPAILGVGAFTLSISAMLMMTPPTALAVLPKQAAQPVPASAPISAKGQGSLFELHPGMLNLKVTSRKIPSGDPFWARMSQTFGFPLNDVELLDGTGTVEFTVNSKRLPYAIYTPLAPHMPGAPLSLWISDGQDWHILQIPRGASFKTVEAFETALVEQAALSESLKKAPRSGSEPATTASQAKGLPWELNGARFISTPDAPLGVLLSKALPSLNIKSVHTLSPSGLGSESPQGQGDRGGFLLAESLTLKAAGQPFVILPLTPSTTPPSWSPNDVKVVLGGGQMIRIKDSASVLKDRLAYRAVKTFQNLPLDHAITFSYGGGGPAQRHVAIFSDPDCPFCQELERTLHAKLIAQKTNVSLHYFLTPLTGIHPQAMDKARRIWCAGPDNASRAKAWLSWMMKHDLVTNDGSCKAGDVIEENVEMARAKNLITNPQGQLSTPTVRFDSGFVSGGDPDVITQMINKPGALNR